MFQCTLHSLQMKPSQPAVPLSAECGPLSFSLKPTVKSVRPATRNSREKLAAMCFEIGYKFHILIIILQSVLVFTQHLCK